MATESTYRCIEELDVFTVPHCRMKHLLKRLVGKIELTDFSSSKAFSDMLTELYETFTELKQHEEIENKYIMHILKRKLEGEALKKLLIHLHAHSHIADILNQINKTNKKLRSGKYMDMQQKGTKLNAKLHSFYNDYVPHMIEEEQVLQPMLLKYVSPGELKNIKNVVLQLHKSQKLEEKILDLEIEKEDSKVFDLPVELLIKVFSYLGPKDLCHCSQVAKLWKSVAVDGRLWEVLHPIRWAKGDWRFSSVSSSDENNCDCSPNYKLQTFNEYESFKYSNDYESYSVENDDENDEQFKKEVKILNGISCYLLPHVGSSVKCLVLECSKAITNGLLFRILTQCKNLQYFDVSQTIISDLGLMGLFKSGCQELRHFDVSGCKNITDKTLVKLSASIGKMITKRCCGSLCQEKVVPAKSFNTRLSPKKNQSRQLQTLRLSGCYKITDVGLRALAKYGGLPTLRHLDLSGCINLTTEGITLLVRTCLELEEFFYCDNLSDVDCKIQSQGCQNNGCANRVCCRTIPARSSFDFLG